MGTMATRWHPHLLITTIIAMSLRPHRTVMRLRRPTILRGLMEDGGIAIGITKPRTSDWPIRAIGGGRW